MTTYFPEDIFKNILSYCDDTIERKQKELWQKIKPVRCEKKCEYDEDEDDTVSNIYIGFLFERDKKYGRGQETLWLIEYDNWELDENNGDCLLSSLENEDTWSYVREHHDIMSKNLTCRLSCGRTKLL
jgi:hypothetical protein